MAIKLIASEPSVESTTEARDRLTREAKALARISHPNVVRVFQVGAIEGQVFLAMEYVDGGTLLDWLLEATILAGHPGRVYRGGARARGRPRRKLDRP